MGVITDRITPQPENSNVEPTILFVYRSPIERGSWWNGRVIVVFYSQGQIYAEVLEKGRTCKLPLRGGPQQLSHAIDRLRNFFSSTFLTIEKRMDGAYSYIRTNPSLKGGMITQADLLPMYPGYAIGSLISKINYMLPLLNKKRRTLESEMEQAKVESEELRESSAFKNADGSLRQTMGNIASHKLNKLIERYKIVCDEINRLYQSQSVALITVEETLPIDPARSPIRVEDRSFQSERMQHLIFHKAAVGPALDHERLQEKVERFVAQLFSQELPASSIPSGAIEGVVNSIENILETENQISLVGSFITSPRVMVMDPVKLRRDSRISSELKKNAANYYVLTEAALGAVFLGLGKSTSAQVEANANGQSLMSRLAMISFISQGAIPKPSKDANDVNLWSVYLQWKETLHSDPRSGYPIGFRVRPLLDILIENQVSDVVDPSSAGPKGDDDEKSPAKT